MERTSDRSDPTLVVHTPDEQVPRQLLKYSQSQDEDDYEDDDEANPCLGCQPIPPQYKKGRQIGEGGFKKVQ